MSALKVAVVGAGYFSQFHYASWRALPDVTCVGACDHDWRKAAATGLPAFETLEAMLVQTTPDILDIVLPPDAHRTAIEAALAAQVPTIICQKPFCGDLAQAQWVTDHAEAAGATLIVHENFRFQPWYRALRAALDANAIGQVHQMTFRLRPGDGQGPQAYIDRQPYFQRMERFLVHETAVHWIDTFRYLFGDPIAVYADLRQMNAVIAGEDAGYIVFDHQGGVRSLFDGNRSLDHAAENHRCTMGEALVEGTEGTLTLYGDGSLWRRRFGETQTTPLFAAQAWDGFGGGCVDALQRHVVAALRNKSTPENTARSYLRVLEIEDATYRSAQLGQKLALVGAP
ncbi:MAG: Gfo/Idh/MocA family oxidoreductase [Pseudomonadota bacterium]